MLSFLLALIANRYFLKPCPEVVIQVFMIEGGGKRVLKRKNYSPQVAVFMVISCFHTNFTPKRKKPLVAEKVKLLPADQAVPGPRLDKGRNLPNCILGPLIVLI